MCCEVSNNETAGQSPPKITAASKNTNCLFPCSLQACLSLFSEEGLQLNHPALRSCQKHLAVGSSHSKTVTHIRQFHYLSISHYSSVIHHFNGGGGYILLPFLYEPSLIIGLITKYIKNTHSWRYTWAFINTHTQWSLANSDFSNLNYLFGSLDFLILIMHKTFLI